MKPEKLLFHLALAIAFFWVACKKERSCESCQTNKSPIAVAGPDQTISLPTNSIFLDGSASNDPDGSITTWQWSKVSGPVSFAMANTGIAKTQVNDLAEGTYLFELKVTDAGGLFDRDTMQVTVNQEASTSLVDVFVAGQQGGVAQYWKNGNAVTLSNGEIANDIYVSGSDVYVAGQEYLGGGIYQIAKYWKNGIAVNLTNGISYAGANDIYVSGNDIYVAGWETDINPPQAKYWKNDVAVNLSNGHEATSIYVSGNDVYVAGYDPGQVAKYWKNGIGVNLSTDSSDYSFANDIYVSGNDVFVAGRVGEKIYYDSVNWEMGPSSAVYWKNGIPVNLPNGSIAYSIYLSGNDVYVAGLEYDGNNMFAKYWKNGVAVNLPNGTQAKSIYVYGNDVYVAGDNNGKAKYWKNGVEVSLSNGLLQSWALSIVIMAR